MDVVENIVSYIEKQKLQIEQMNYFSPLCQLQLLISQNRPVRLVPCFVRVHHIFYTKKWECIDPSGVTGGGGVPPKTTDLEIFADLLGKTWQGKMGKGVKIEKKRRKIVKEKVEIENWRWKSYKMRRGIFFFFFLPLTFQMMKSTKICFGSTKIEIFYREKAFHTGIKIRKNDFAPSEIFSCYTPDWSCEILWFVAKDSGKTIISPLTDTFSADYMPSE